MRRLPPPHRQRSARHRASVVGAGAGLALLGVLTSCRPWDRFVVEGIHDAASDGPLAMDGDIPRDAPTPPNDGSACQPACSPAQMCRDGACICPSGRTRCDERCVVGPCEEAFPMLVSVSTTGEQGNSPWTEHDYQPAISADGRFVAFIAHAPNLVIGDTNNASDVLVRDTWLESTARVSIASDGTEGNLDSFAPDISADGRFVLFTSLADNLANNDNNNQADIFLHDTNTGQTELISRTPSGASGNGASQTSSLSADGRFVAFSSNANDLVAGDTGRLADIFLLDRRTNVLRRISNAIRGNQADGDSFFPRISADGRYVCFASSATNLVEDDTNSSVDIFVFDQESNTTRRVSLTSDGTQADGHSASPSISGNGQHILFTSRATNLASGIPPNSFQVYSHDRRTQRTSIISTGIEGTAADGYSTIGTSSFDGRYVSFYSSAGDLVPGDTFRHGDMYVRDTSTQRTIRISINALGERSNQGSPTGVIAANGHYVVFMSHGSNVVSSDRNGQPDFFLTRVRW